jgi:hypothetical protein
MVPYKVGIFYKDLEIQNGSHNRTLSAMGKWIKAFISELIAININLSDELFNSSAVVSAKQVLSITANKITVICVMICVINDNITLSFDWAFII